MATFEDSSDKRTDWRPYALPVVVCLGLLTVLLRLWYLQIVRGQELSEIALRGRTISVPIPAPRGQIVDRHGRPLAGVRPALALMVTPIGLYKNEQAVRSVSSFAGIDANDLTKEIEDNLFRKHLPFVARVGLTEHEALSIDERRAFFPGAFVRPETIRTYPAGSAAAHVVGYVGALNEQDVGRLQREGLDLPSFVGKVGIERAQDELLIGAAGKESVEVDSRGRQIRPQTSTAPVPGTKLVLTIDLKLQELCTSLLSGRRGAIVALEPRTGEVLALVSAPTYDPTVFAERGPKDKINAVLKNPAQPMHNRASGSAYAPGSTFKPCTLAAAVKNGVLTPSTTFVCNGSIRIGNRTFRCLGHHGRINYETAMEKSCNVFYAELANSLKRVQIAAVANQMGLGVRTGIDLPSERSGIIPTDEWLARRKLEWFPGDTINMAVGQGYVEATPLQMANYIALIANRGVSFKPRLLRAVVPFGATAQTKFTEPQVGAQLDLPQEWWTRLHRALVKVVQSGTAGAAQIPGITVAGKTGSAEHRRGQRSHSWFVAYAPAEQPKIAIAVVIETAGHGGDVAAPIARRVIERYLKPAASSSALSAAAVFPDAR